ncbi:MAG: DUF655 domain-containing protein [Promethearchaeota archaeon]|nr:MAG: DUF655 domain-containing protein [Candidatus Lokiarchaeota archaeon]
MTDPERKRTSHPSHEGNQKRPFRKFDNRDQRGTGNRPRSRSTVYIKKGVLVFVLDILQHGGVDKAGHSWHPISQVIEVPSYRLLEVNLNKKLIPDLILNQKILYQGTEDSPLGRVNKVLKYDDLTLASITTLQSVLETYVKENEKIFVEFINSAGPITLKRHSLEILPGVGKKIMWEIINFREKHPFTSFKEIRENVPGFKPVEVIAKRIIEELSDEDQKRFLFVKHHHKPMDNPSHDRTSRPESGGAYHRR